MNLITRNEEILLLAIWRLQGEAYGISIKDVIFRTTGMDWSIGAIYGPLRRLEEKGLVICQEGEPLPERGGRGRVYYQLSDRGKDSLRKVVVVNDQLWSGIPSLTNSPSS